MLLNTMVRERLENDNEVKTASLRVQLLEQVFTTFDVAELVEAGFHQFIYEAIKSEQVSRHSFFLPFFLLTERVV